MKRTQFTNNVLLMIGLGVFLLCTGGCTRRSGNAGLVQHFSYNNTEAAWIRNGEPIEYEGESWYPADDTETLMDSEVYIIGEYRGVQYFVDRVDVRPYDRLYTKFGHYKFRYFERRQTE